MFVAMFTSTTGWSDLGVLVGPRSESMTCASVDDGGQKASPLQSEFTLHLPLFP